MADLFISYSRRDQPFVRRLERALSERGRDAWVDWDDIPPTARWMDEVRAAIESADSFVFVVSPDSVRSPVCRLEVDHAMICNKRLVPLLYRDADGDVPAPVAAHNWISFREERDFEVSVDVLARALDTDLEWVRGHTRLLVRAREWEAAGHDPSFMVRGRDLDRAEAWLASSARHADPKPTELQTEYLIASRRAATRAQRGRFGAISVALVVSVALATAAVLQRGTAIRERDRAEQEAAVARSRELSASADLELTNDPELSILLAREALRIAPTPQAVNSLRRGLASSHVRVVMRGQEGPIRSLAVSPDGMRVATGTENGTVRLWNAVTGAAELTWRAHKGLVQDLRFSPDGRRLLSSGDHTAAMWDVRTGNLELRLRGHDSWVFIAAFDPPGERILTASDDGTARVWDAQTGERQLILSHEDPLLSAVFSPDGSTIVTAGLSHQVGLWDATTGRHLHWLNHSSYQVLAAVFSPDGTTLATMAWLARKVALWDVASGRRKAVLRVAAEALRKLAISPDGTLVAATTQDGVQLWDASTNQTLAVLRHPTPPSDLAFHPGGQLLATASGSVGRVWDIRSGDIAATLAGHSGDLTRIGFSTEGAAVFSTAADGTTRRWQPMTTPLISMGKYRDSVTDAAISPDGSLVSVAGWDGGVDVWALDGTRVAELAGHEDVVRSISFDPGGDRILTASEDGTAKLSTVSGRLLTSLEHGVPVQYAAFTPDGERIVTIGHDVVGAGIARVWSVDVRSGRSRQLLSAKEHWFLRLVGFLRKPVRAVISGTDLHHDRTWLISPATGEVLRTFAAQTDDVHPDGSALLVRDGIEGRLISSEDGRGLGRVPEADGEFSSGGGFVITDEALQAVRLWDPRTGQLVTELRGQPEMLGGFTDPSDRYVVTGSTRGSAWLWDARTGERLAVLTGHVKSVAEGAFLSDGRTILTFGPNPEVLLYRCELCGDAAQLERLADRRVTRELTAAEEHRYGLTG